jgi:ketosteroid isomerase-like protein
VADGALLRELNDDIWHEFRRAYAACDGAAYLALHTPDLIRAGGPAKEVLGRAAYEAQALPWMAEVAGRGDELAIDFRFLERLVGDELASERGVYQLTVRPAGKEQRTLYGKFHTFARKDGGRWRIAVDYDSNENGTVTAETYAAASAIDDVAAFE